MTDTEATDTAAAAKPEKTPEQKAAAQAARIIARALGKLEAGTPEEVKGRWTENKSKYTADARKLVRALGKDGITLQYDETKARKPGRGGKKAKAKAAETAE